MKFLQMLPGQKLILARIETRQPPTLPAIARSTHRQPAPPLWLIFVIWLCAALGRPLAHKIRNAWPGVVALAFLVAVLGNVILEDVAGLYIQKMLGA
jgi:hypothetical protein